jgi:O-antigen ligase
MRAIGPVLLAVLTFAVATLWVRDRWAVCGIEVLVFLPVAWCLARVIHRREPVIAGFIPAALLGVCICGAVQVAAHTTVVRAETADTVLYWLAAACFSWLGMQVCAQLEMRTRFLKAAVAIGSTVCLVGVIQLFTSEGRVFWIFPSGFGDGVIGPFVSRNNYAAFVELLVPVALVLSFKDRRWSKAYLVLAAALVASVIAAGSRAGAAIVTAETAVAFTWQMRSGRTRFNRRWILFAVVLTGFVAIAGHQFLWERFSSDRDPLQFRREFVESSIAMLRARPVRGFGLGTWPWAYRQYALIDTGLIVNHAHNEWVQWGAEGGLPVLLLMLGLLALCIRGAIRSVWGLGIVAVFVHSLVDYPFMRLGLAAWVFTFAGALAAYNRDRDRLERGYSGRPVLPGPVLRVLAAACLPVLAFAVWNAARTAWADRLFRQATPETIARAVQLRPDRAEYRFAQAQSDREHAIQHLKAALSINPYLTEAAIPLASQLEWRGDAAGAEATLLDLARRDRQYAPALALSNFYFRSCKFDAFWQWARTAATVAPGGMAPLFDLCFAVTSDASLVTSRVVDGRRSVEREYLQFLIARGQFGAARRAALRLAVNADTGDRDPLLEYVDASIGAARFEDAATVWNELCSRRLLPYAPVSGGTLVNGDFARTVLNRGFDWQMGAPGCATVALTRSGGSALELFLTGNRPDTCEIYRQFLYLRPGTERVLRFQYRTLDLPDRTGLRWSIGTQEGAELLASSQWTDGEWRWAPARASGRLCLSYRRDSGSTRREGILFLRQVRLEPDTATP